MKIKEGGGMDAQQQKFELAIKEAFPNSPQYLNKNPDGTYRNTTTFGAWIGWKLAAKAQAVPEWISVKDKLPEIGVYVMVFLGKQGHNPTTYNFCQYTKFGFHLSNVTHWMSLPDAPKPQESAND